MVKNSGVVCFTRVADDGCLCKYVVVALLVGGAKTRIERRPRYARLKDYVVVLLHEAYHRLARREVEALCHTDAKMVRTLEVEFANGCHENVVGRAVVGAVTSKGYYVCRIVHGAKITKLP